MSEMAFLIANWARSSVSANEPITTLIGGVVVGCFREYLYQTTDSQATVSASGYFNQNTAGTAVAYNGVATDIVTGDYVNVYSSASGGSLFRYRLTNTSGVITTSLASGGDGVFQTVTAITAAQINAMYTTPISLVPAQGANTILVLESVVLRPSNLLTTDFTAGGVAFVQYTATTAGGGLAASGTVAATEFTSDAETTTSIFMPLTTSGNSAVAGTLIANAPLCLTNATQDFATGTITYNAYTRARVLVVAAAA
jgi:hypothetical protein